MMLSSELGIDTMNNPIVKNKTEIMIKESVKPEAEEVLRLLDELTQSEKKEFLVFMQGIRFAKRYQNVEGSRNGL